MARQRIRLRYKKDDVLKYIGHRDLLRFIHKLVRRSGLPVATSGKFSPKPRITFGPALPLGVAAHNELVDIELKDGESLDQADLENLRQCLGRFSAPRDFVGGLDLIGEEVAPVSKSAVAGRYRIQCEETAGAINALLESGELKWEHRGKEHNLTGAIIRYNVGDGFVLVDGWAGSTPSLNIVHLCKAVSAGLNTGPFEAVRECLLDQGSNPL